MGNWAEAQKRSWCSRELGFEVEVITCLSRQKGARGRERAGSMVPVLVDDRIKLKESWEEAGGIFIHHTNSRQSIQALKELGF